MLPNGNVFVGWGAQPLLSEFAPSGELIFDAQLGTGYISYRAYRGRGRAAAPALPPSSTRRAGAGTTST